MMNSAEPPRDNLVRSVLGDDAAAMGTEGRTLFGHFARFNEWTEINSVYEGRFLERNAPGAFAESIERNGSRIKALYDHGKDPQLGNKPLGPFLALREDEAGGYYELDLIETDYNDHFVIPAARAGLLGSSYRFSVAEDGDAIEKPMRATKWNPDRLPERTVVKAELYELGPVTFPAYAGTDVAVRSGTDDFLDHLMNDPRFLARFMERTNLVVVERLLALVPPTAQEERAEDAEPPTASGDETPDSSANGQPSPSTSEARKAYSRRAYVTSHGVGKKYS